MSFASRLSKLAGAALVLSQPALAGYSPHAPDHQVCPAGKTIIELQPAEVIYEQAVDVDVYCPSNTEIPINDDVTITVTDAPKTVVTRVTCFHTSHTTYTKTITVDPPAYTEDPGYGEDPKYHEDPSYGEDTKYHEDPSYDEDTCDEEPSYSEDPGYGEDTKYHEDPSYVEDPSYTDKATYPEKPSYTDKVPYPEEPSYTNDVSYPGEPSYTNDVSYPGGPIYTGEPTAPEEDCHKVPTECTVLVQLRGLPLIKAANLCIKALELVNYIDAVIPCLLDLDSVSSIGSNVLSCINAGRNAQCLKS